MNYCKRNIRLMVYYPLGFVLESFDLQSELHWFNTKREHKWIYCSSIYVLFCCSTSNNLRNSVFVYISQMRSALSSILYYSVSRLAFYTLHFCRCFERVWSSKGHTWLYCVFNGSCSPFLWQLYYYYYYVRYVQLHFYFIQVDVCNHVNVLLILTYYYSYLILNDWWLKMVYSKGLIKYMHVLTFHLAHTM